ncbi:MAG: hypothetical protein EOM64_09675 [Erysipelotrichia bacterium]|nr:hypothetical protein [Erysipelotrichia bacterium]
MASIDKTLRKALKRNEPMKVKRVPNELGWYNSNCPNCDKSVYGASDFCTYCGQKLDWRSKDEKKF